MSKVSCLTGLYTLNLQNNQSPDILKWAALQQNQQNGCAPSEDSFCWFCHEAATIGTMWFYQGAMSPKDIWCRPWSSAVWTGSTLFTQAVRKLWIILESELARRQLTTENHALVLLQFCYSQLPVGRKTPVSFCSKLTAVKAHTCREKSFVHFRLIIVEEISTTAWV